MNRKKIIIALVGIVVIIVVGFGIFQGKDFVTLIRYRQIINNMTVADVDLSKIPDGQYKGSSDAIWVAADVVVTIQEHKITKIELVRHLNERGKPAEIITDRVVSAQTLKVDTISGATSSSKVILKAIEKALTNQ